MILCCSILSRRTIKPQTYNYGQFLIYPRWDIHMWESSLFSSIRMKGRFWTNPNDRNMLPNEPFYHFCNKKVHFVIYLIIMEHTQVFTVHSAQYIEKIIFPGVDFWNIKKTCPYIGYLEKCFIIYIYIYNTRTCQFYIT